METPVPSPSRLDGLRLIHGGSAEQRYRTCTLLLFVSLQCLLYGMNLQLLPMWGRRGVYRRHR